MIELQEVTKMYDGRVKAVDAVSFTVRRGEIFGLIGTSGCGKTTTLKVINRLIEPTSGRILVDGKPADAVPPEELRRNIGYVIQNVGLFPHYTIKENLSIVPKLLDWDQPRIDRRCEELMELVGLDPSEYIGRKPQALSGGQQQRIGFARALAADPEVILMDEPFGALDPITKEQIQNEFKNLLHEIDKTIVLVTHDVSEAFDLCDRVALMDGGQLQQTGTPKELLMKPASEFVASFFDVNRLELEMETITVGDIVAALRDRFGRKRITSPDEREGMEDLVSVGETDSFADAYARINRDRAGRLNVVEQTGEGEVVKGIVEAEDLLAGFHLVRNRTPDRSGEGGDG
ncbi:MAG: ATP-binding cassette domain-containing protein [Balneolaceae bacterium]|nr:ATP-binding cassette domain-containing protein [Balneolaceae bacterium]